MLPLLFCSDLFLGRLVAVLESFKALLNGEKAEEIVWAADLSYWIAAQEGNVDTTNGLNTEIGNLKLCRKLGCMPYYWYDQFWAGQLVSSCCGKPKFDTVLFTADPRSGIFPSNSVLLLRLSQISLQNQFFKRTSSAVPLTPQSFTLLASYNRVSKTRLWHKTARPTLAA